MRKGYDVVIIGTGVAASTIAQKCRSAGREVAIIDHRPYGGTCALRGCTPKKVLAHAASVVDAVACMKGKGVSERASIDWAELMAFKRSFTDPVPEKTEQGLAEDGIATYHGRARFVEPRAVQVGDEVLEARQVVIAAGAEPVRLPIAGFEHLATSDDFLKLDALPKRIIFIGGGYIAFEFAHVAARAGAQVTVLQRGDRVLKKFDPHLVGWLVERTRGLGVEIHLNCEVKAVEKDPQGFTVHTQGADGEQRFSADLVVHSAGRAPALEELDLDKAGVELDGKQIKLNDYLQSVSNPAVYVVGDAAEQGPPLTPVASLDAQVVAANLLEGNRSRPDYTGVPSVVFSIPPIARVGLLEEEARSQGLHFQANCQNTANWFTARHTGEDCAGFKTLIEEGSGRLLGAHLLGPHADEVINLFALAIRSGLTAADLKQAILVFPTAAHDIGSML